LVSAALLCLPIKAFGATETIVTVTPSITEIVYALGLEGKVIAVSSHCNYPEAAKNKPKIGSLYGINKEQIIRLRPTYVLALETNRPFMAELEGAGIKMVYFDFNNVDDILNAIIRMGEMFGADEKAQKLVAGILEEIKPANDPARQEKTILYVIQSQPLITIGSKSFLTDAIRLSGNISVSAGIPVQYPSISLEHAIKLKPDYIVMGPFADMTYLKPFFNNKNTKFVEMTGIQNDVINRPGPRIREAIEFFRVLK
jgi:iron complex transport system substrate-binding protein